MKNPLKPQPVGRNWQYDLGEAGWLLRNTQSVEPELDGWWLTHEDPGVRHVTPHGTFQRAHVRVSPATALLLLRGLRAVRQP
jgi:hypothetical protein